ncbi:MAG TPA: Fur family transcriptional regulator [Chloroflexota bacterium]|nr:Fur family transcriptional regulator [Chloroflexota bacterium]
MSKTAAPVARRGGNLSRAEWMLRRLDEEGLRLTGRRELVVNAIAHKPGSFTPEALVDELRPHGIGRATVYRALDVLERLGVLTRVHLGTCHAFTVCDDGHHHHFLCSACSAVVPVDASVIESEIQQLATRLKFQVDTHMLEFAGRCADCLAKDS